MNGDGWLKMGGACLVLVFGGCGRMTQSVYLSGCDRDISSRGLKKRSMGDPPFPNRYNTVNS